MSWQEGGRFNLRESVRTNGPKMVAEVIMAKIKENKFDLEETSIRELWDAFTDGAPLSSGTSEEQWQKILESVGTGSFIKITGSLINKKIIEAYDAYEKIGDQLVTVVPSKLYKETITGTTALALPDVIPEHGPYKDSGFEEKYVEIQNTKYGKIISLTEEMVYMDQTGRILTLARAIGEGAAEYKEMLVVEGIQDLNTKSYYPSGAATAVFSSGNKNLLTGNPFSFAGLDAVMIQSQRMMSDGQDDRYINVNLIGKILLGPAELVTEMFELSTGVDHPETAERAKNFFRGKFVPMTSPWITKRSPTTWYWGDWKRSCWWMQVWPLQNFTSKPGHEDAFNKDIITKFKTRFFGGFGYVDHRRVFKATV